MTAEGGKIAGRGQGHAARPDVKFEVDLVVLATGMVPTTVDEPILNLAYRQGPELPTLKYGFPDSHFICFPYETRRTGIYAAGCRARADGHRDRCRSDGAGAALKAIQAIELAAQRRGRAPARRATSRCPDFFLQRCTQCKRCTEECPFGALDEDEKGTPKPNPTPLPPLRHLHGRLPGAHHLLHELLGRHDRLDDQGDRRPGRRGEPTHPRADLRERRLPGARHGRPGAHQVQPAHAASSRCAASARINLVWMADALSRGSTGVLLHRLQARRRTTSATSSRAASCAASG